MNNHIYFVVAQSPQCICTRHMNVIQSGPVILRHVHICRQEAAHFARVFMYFRGSHNTEDLRLSHQLPELHNSILWTITCLLLKLVRRTKKCKNACHPYNNAISNRITSFSNKFWLNNLINHRKSLTCPQHDLSFYDHFNWDCTLRSLNLLYFSQNL